MKILKEKVVDDEKKSGIGSLFDDEKSSFQHIALPSRLSFARLPGFGLHDILKYTILIEQMNSAK